MTFAGCAANVPENLSENGTESSESLTEYPVETESLPETTIAESVTEKITETAAEALPENNSTVNEEEPLPDPENYDPRTVEYINSLWKLEKFRQEYPADILIADLNGDNIPEVVLQIATVVSISNVFSIKDGKAFYVPPAPGSYTPDYYEKSPDYSFDGGSLEYYEKNGEPIFLADCWMGGSAGGTAGIMNIDFDGQQITASALSRIYISNAGYTYFWGDDEVSGDEYDRCLEEYMASLDYTDNYTVYIPKTMHDSELKSNIEFIAEGLDRFYKILDLEISGISPEYTVRMKPIYSELYKSSSDNDSTAVSYDGFGNVSAVYRSSNGLTSYDNIYDETGRLCRITESLREVSVPDKVYEIDPEDWVEFNRTGYIRFTDNTPGENQLIEYDDRGRMVRKSIIADEEIYSWGALTPSAYAPEGFDPESRVQSVTEFEYDEADRLVREEYTVYLRDESDKSQHYIKIWEYDGSGELLRYELLGEYSYEISYNENSVPERVVFTDEGMTYELDIKEHYHDLKGGVTCLLAKGDTPYKKDIDCCIYFAPVRTIS
ncbi:MAG: hypothetical protein K2K57_11065 [Oscillospiraceae bacterium]|nr:hypothetical protein [Oscillospiraceae bacterium]